MQESNIPSLRILKLLVFQKYIIQYVLSLLILVSPPLPTGDPNRSPDTPRVLRSANPNPTPPAACCGTAALVGDNRPLLIGGGADGETGREEFCLA